MALIRAETLKDDLENMKSNCNHMSDQILIDTIKELVDAQPTIDVVPVSVLEQVKWERDVALTQLEEYGVSLGEKADVMKVRHGRWESTEVLVGLMNFEYFYRCTACGRRGGDTKTNYCPHCGALMDKEE